MTDSSWSEDERLGELFQPSAQPGDNQPMRDDLPITMEQLAATAGRFFGKASMRDIPEKLWLDCYHNAQPPQVYLRATFDHRLTGGCLIRLAALKNALEAEHGISVVAVAYHADMTWPDAEQLNEQLNGVF